MRGKRRGAGGGKGCAGCLVAHTEVRGGEDGGDGESVFKTSKVFCRGGGVVQAELAAGEVEVGG